MKKDDQISQLTKVFVENKLSHSYLVVTTNIEQTVNEIKRFLCNIFDKKDNNFKKLLNTDSHPNVVIIKPKENKIKKDSIDNLKRAFSLKPTMISYNVYIICEPEKMNSTAYNRLLKFIEEPEKNIFGFFVTKNKIMVPETIVSRCEIIKSKYEEDQCYYEDEELYLRAMEFIENIEKKSNILWYNNNNLFKKITEREMVIKFLNYLLNIYRDDLYNKNIYVNNYSKIQIINKYIEQLNYNVNVNILLNSFGIEMSELNEKI
ncbi:MAG: hypothetical protein GX951_02815 [Mollicutes bacterium]|nr:hypothetical protein [Mollicutes bacterium]